MTTKQKPVLLALLLFATRPAFACITCDRRIREGIFNSAFGQNVLVMILPFAVLGGIVALLAKASHKHYATQTNQTPVPLLSASLILGIGFGGFIDPHFLTFVIAQDALHKDAPSIT